MQLFKTIIFISLIIVLYPINTIVGDKHENKRTIKSKKLTYINIEGLVNVDGLPAAADIEIASMHKFHSSIERVYSNVKTGEFKTALKTGDEYDIIVRVHNVPQQILNLNAKMLDSTKTLNIYVDFTTPAYDNKVEDLKRVVELKFRSDINLSSFEKQFGKTKKDQLIYKIQVGAFKFYENFNYSSVIDLPKIIRQTDNDQITRFTIGNYSNYSEANEMLKKVQSSDLKEAFIIAYYKDERKYLSQLVSEKILH
jgi:hypothetical protein